MLFYCVTLEAQEPTSLPASAPSSLPASALSSPTSEPSKDAEDGATAPFALMRYKPALYAGGAGLLTLALESRLVTRQPEPDLFATFRELPANSQGLVMLGGVSSFTLSGAILQAGWARHRETGRLRSLYVASGLMAANLAGQTLAVLATESKHNLFEPFYATSLMSALPAATILGLKTLTESAQYLIERRPEDRPSAKETKATPLYISSGASLGVGLLSYTIVERSFDRIELAAEDPNVSEGAAAGVGLAAGIIATSSMTGALWSAGMARYRHTQKVRPLYISSLLIGGQTFLRYAILISAGFAQENVEEEDPTSPLFNDFMAVGLGTGAVVTIATAAQAVFVHSRQLMEKRRGKQTPLADPEDSTGTLSLK
jgi:hypothetical protein